MKLLKNTKPAVWYAMRPAYVLHSPSERRDPRDSSINTSGHIMRSQILWLRIELM